MRNYDEEYKALQKFWCSMGIRGNLFAYFLLAFIFFGLCVPVASVILSVTYRDKPDNLSFVGYLLSAVIFAILMLLYRKRRLRKFYKKADQLRSYGMWEGVLDDFGRNRDNLFLDRVVLGDTSMICKDGSIMPYCFIKTIRFEEAESDTSRHYFIHIISMDERFPEVSVAVPGLGVSDAGREYTSLCRFVYEKNPNVAFENKLNR